MSRFSGPRVLPLAGPSSKPSSEPCSKMPQVRNQSVSACSGPGLRRDGQMLWLSECAGCSLLGSATRSSPEVLTTTCRGCPLCSCGAQSPHPMALLVTCRYFAHWSQPPIHNGDIEPPKQTALHSCTCRYRAAWSAASTLPPALAGHAPAEQMWPSAAPWWGV